MNGRPYAKNNKPLTSYLSKLLPLRRDESQACALIWCCDRLLDQYLQRKTWVSPGDRSGPGIAIRFGANPTIEIRKD